MSDCENSLNFSCFYYKIGKEGEHEERAAMKKEIEKKIQQVSAELRQEKDALDALALECIKRGRSLAEDENVLRQNEKVDTLVLTELRLREMLEERESDQQ